MDPIRFSVCIPTIGRSSLARTLDSIASQRLRDGDEILVVGDTLDGPLPESKALVQSYGAPFWWREFAGESHCWGNPQRNWAIDRARRGNWLVWIDDTDVFTPGAFTAMRVAINDQDEPRPHLFRFYAANGEIIPRRRVIIPNQVGGHQFVTPNLPGLVGRWGTVYTADYDFIASTLALWPANAVIWRDEIIADCRESRACVGVA